MKSFSQIFPERIGIGDVTIPEPGDPNQNPKK